MDVALLLHSAWLLPALALLVALDGPFPVVPSEPLLMTASAVAIGAHDVPMALGLFVAAFAGSVVGDHLLFALGRTSRRLVRPGSGGIAGWVRRNIARRPAVTIVGARFVPAGRLVSTTAAGRYGVTLRRFLPCSILSSALWAGYMMGVGLLLGPITGGDPLRGLVAGIAMGALTAGAFALVERMRARRTASRPSELPDRAVPVERRGGGDSGQGLHLGRQPVVALAEEREGLDAQLPGEGAYVREQALGLRRSVQPAERYGPQVQRREAEWNVGLTVEACGGRVQCRHRDRGALDGLRGVGGARQVGLAERGLRERARPAPRVRPDLAGRPHQLGVVAVDAGPDHECHAADRACRAQHATDPGAERDLDRPLGGRKRDVGPAGHHAGETEQVVLVAQLERIVLVEPGADLLELRDQLVAVVSRDEAKGVDGAEDPASRHAVPARRGLQDE
jgi:membrane-associated protein